MAAAHDSIDQVILVLKVDIHTQQFLSSQQSRLRGSPSAVMRPSISLSPAGQLQRDLLRYGADHGLSA